MAPANNRVPLYVADSLHGDVRESGQRVARASFVEAELNRDSSVLPLSRAALSIKCRYPEAYDNT